MSISKAITPDVEERISQKLEPDETIRWAEIPVRKFFTNDAVAPFLLAIPWIAFVLYWCTGYEQEKDHLVTVFEIPYCSLLFIGVPFILIGLFMLSSPLRAYRKAGKTVYAVSNKRAIIFRVGRKVRIQAWCPEDFSDIQVEEHGDGTGDVLFARLAKQHAGGGSSSEEVGFMHIKSYHQARERLNNLAEQAD